MSIDLERTVVGPRVRHFRRALGWTQDQLAERLAAHGHRMHQVTVAKLEAGSRPIRVNEVAALAVILGRPLADFLDEKLADDSRPSERIRREAVLSEARKEFRSAVQTYERALMDAYGAHVVESVMS